MEKDQLQNLNNFQIKCLTESQHEHDLMYNSK